MSHIGSKEFETINWLPVGDRFEQCVSTHVYKFFNCLNPDYMSDIFLPAKPTNRMTRRSSLKLNKPLRKSTNGQKALSYLGPNIWNDLPNSTKEAVSVNSFKHQIKKHFFSSLKSKENNPFLLS